MYTASMALLNFKFQVLSNAVNILVTRPFSSEAQRQGLFTALGMFVLYIMT
jgi:hypothetical protein